MVIAIIWIFLNFFEYCDELFNGDSICCLRQSFDMFKKTSYEVFFDFFGFCILFVPIITLMWAFFAVFVIIISKRNKKYDDINYIENRPLEKFESFFLYILFFLIAFVYSLTNIILLGKCHI